MSKKIFVLGANSFSGQDFVDLLLDETDYQVFGVSRSPERKEVSLKYLLNPKHSNYSYHKLDLNDDIENILALLDKEKPQFIVNFAAQSEVAPSWINPDQWFQTNTVSLAKLVNHLRNQDYLEKYLHVSSPEAYGTCVGVVKEDAPLNPSTPYAASKAAADMLLSTYYKQYDFPLLTVRATNVYGARQQLFKIIPRSVIYQKIGKTIELHGGGVAKKSYIHIRDVSNGELAILNKGKLGEIYNISPKDGISIKDVVSTICDKMDNKFEEVTKIVDERPGQDAAYVIDSTKARETLGWSPNISFDEGIEEVVKWINDYWDEIKDMPHEYQHKK